MAESRIHEPQLKGDWQILPGMCGEAWRYIHELLADNK